MKVKELDKILHVLIEEEYMGENLGDVVDEIQKYNSQLNDLEMEAATIIVVRKLLESGKIYAGNKFENSRLVKWKYPVESILVRVNSAWKKKRNKEISELEFCYMIWFEYENHYLEELKSRHES